jgi:hypothetical protein
MVDKIATIWSVCPHPGPTSYGWQAVIRLSEPVLGFRALLVSCAQSVSPPINETLVFGYNPMSGKVDSKILEEKTGQCCLDDLSILQGWELHYKDNRAELDKLYLSLSSYS